MNPIVVDAAFIAAMDEHRKVPPGTPLLKACSDNIVVFAEKMLGIRLYAWQVYFLRGLQDIIEGRSEYTDGLALTSRQIGKSTALAVLGLWSTTFNKKPGTVHNNTNACIVSRSDEQARKLLRDIRKTYRHADRFMSETYKDESGQSSFPIDKKGLGFFGRLMSTDDPNNSTSITFVPWSAKHGEYLLSGSRSGSSVVSLPPTPKVLGNSFSIGLVDEAGHETVTDDFYYNELQPTGDSTDAMFVFTSTPWKPSGFFYSFCDVEDQGMYPNIFRCVFTIEAIKEEAPKQYEKVMRNIELMNADGKIDEVQRSYYCRFVRGEQSFFDPKHVDGVFEDKHKMESSCLTECDMGIDFGGQVTSRTVVTISRLTDDGTIERLYHKTYPVGEDLGLLDDVAELRTRFNIQRIIPDDCPAGHHLIAQMKERGWNVHPMSFRREKVEKYTALRAMMANDRVRSYVDDDLKLEMKALEFSQGKRTTMIDHAVGYRDDMIDSFLMSAYFYVKVEDEKVEFYDWDAN